jgi:hypothetical protein
MNICSGLRLYDRIRLIYFERKKTFYLVSDKPWFIALQVISQIPVIIIIIGAIL